MSDPELREKVARLMHKPVDGASMFYIGGDGVHRMRAQGWGNRPTPCYETDIAAAWDVARHAVSGDRWQHFERHLVTLLTGDKGFYTEYGQFADMCQLAELFMRDNAPELICRAYLAAVEASQE